MFRKYFFITLLFSYIFAVQSTLLYAQEEQGEIIIISEKVGKIIDTKEMIKYDLFPGVEGFKSAVFLRMPDGTYILKLTRIDEVTGEEKIMRIPTTIFIINQYVSIIDPFKIETAQIQTIDGRQMRGKLQELSVDTLLVSAITSPRYECTISEKDIDKIQIRNVSEISLNRPFFMKYGLWGASISVLGILYGLVVGGDDADLPLAIGVYGGSVIAGLGILKSVNIDIPLQDKSFQEKRDIFSRVVDKEYRSPFVLRATPWSGYNFPYRGRGVVAVGGRCRLFVKPRAGLELSYGKTGWFAKEMVKRPYNHWSQLDYFSGGFFFLLPSYKRLTPFFAWGGGLIISKIWDPAQVLSNYDSKNTDVFIDMSGGIGIPLYRWLSFEGRVVIIWDISRGYHYGFQIGVTVGQNY